MKTQFISFFFILQLLNFAYANEEANTDQQKETIEEKKEITTTSIIQEENFEEYQQKVLKHAQKILKEKWIKHPKAKEINGISFIEFESAISSSNGHVFIYPDWNDIYKFLPYGSILSARGFDTFLFLPQIKIENILPNDENEDAISKISNELISYVDVSTNTIGEHDKTNIIFVSGKIPAWILPTLLETRDQNINAIFLLNSYYPNMESNAYLADMISSFSGKILDIITTDSNSWLNDAHQQRKFVMRKKGKLTNKNYQQIISNDLEENLRQFNSYLLNKDFKIYKTKK